jgi:hypothetical protein
MLATITQATIPATKSHGERTITHTPNTGDGTHDATVVVTERTGVRKVRFLTSTYLVEETPADGFDGRSFLVCKDRTNGADADTVAGQKAADRCGNVYECHVFANGVHGGCSCDAMTCSKGKVACVHWLAMRALIAAGLPSPLTNSEADYANTEWDDFAPSLDYADFI